VRKVLSIVAAIAAGGLATPALAGDILWLDSDHTAYGGTYSTGQSLTFSVNGVNVRASAWSISNGIVKQAKIGVWDAGMGVTYGSNDNSHTVDNVGTKDFLLFQFDKVVELEMARFNTGWHSMSDTDATIGYDTNNLAFGAAPAWHNLTQANALSILDLYNSGSPGNSGNSYRDINPDNKTGNLWLVGAYFDGTNPDGRWNKADGFKLEKLTFTQPTTGVPEPSTWATLLVGFFGLGGAMRSRRRQDCSNKGEALSAA
jgi:hypothetical protein